MTPGPFGLVGTGGGTLTGALGADWKDERRERLIRRCGEYQPKKKKKRKSDFILVLFLLTWASLTRSSLLWFLRREVAGASVGSNMENGRTFLSLFSSVSSNHRPHGSNQFCLMFRQCDSNTKQKPLWKLVFTVIESNLQRSFFRNAACMHVSYLALW